jgi:O-antigen/teichoic acid export membrane protein
MQDTENKKKDIKNGVTYFIPLFVKNVFPFITLPIFTRILSPEEYGLLGLSIVYTTFITGIANFGMTLSFERNYFQYKKEPKKQTQLLFSSILFVMGNFLLLLVITYLFLVPLSTFFLKTAEYKWIFLGVFVGFFFYSTINQFYFILLKNEGKAGIFSLFNIYLSLIYVIVSVYLVAFAKVGVWGIIIAQFAAGGIVFSILSIKFIQKLGFSLNRPLLLESLKLSYPLTPRLFLGVLGAQFDTYMVGLLATLGDVGVYHIGKKIANLSFTLMTTIQNVYNPRVYQMMFDDKVNVHNNIGSYLTPFLYFSILMPLCISFFSEELLYVLTPSDYSGAIPVIIILSMYYGILFFSKIVGLQLIFSKKTFITSLLSLLALALNVAINIPLIMYYGIIGAAWGTFVAGLISTTTSTIIARKYYKINWEVKKIITILMVFLLGSLMVLLQFLMVENYLMGLITKMIILSAYLGLGMKLKILSKDSFRMLKSSFAKS